MCSGKLQSGPLKVLPRARECIKSFVFATLSANPAKPTGGSENFCLLTRKMMDSKEVYDAAERVNESGSTKFYMETVWRNPDQVGKRQWQYALEMVRRVCGLAGLKDCTNHGDDRR
uniref:Biotin synthase n=2 Tax=Tetraselmis sp. GSL018 TaxID=582737 RepID=A0A061SCL6_9CHLO